MRCLPSAYSSRFKTRPQSATRAAAFRRSYRLAGFYQWAGNFPRIARVGTDLRQPKPLVTVQSRVINVTNLARARAANHTPVLLVGPARGAFAARREPQRQLSAL